MQSFAELCPPEIEEKFIAILRKGNHRSVAARACNLNPDTVDGWVRRGDGRDRRSGPPSGDVVRFAKRVLEAEALAEVDVVGNIIDAAEKDGNVGLKFLARRYSHRWGEKIETTVNVNWVMQAVKMIRSGDVTLEILEQTLGHEPMLEIQKALEAPVEGEYSEVPS